MRWLICLFFLYVGGSVMAQNQLASFILEKEAAWANALTKTDITALENLYDEQLVYTHSSGTVDTKTTYINSLKTGAVVYKTISRDDVKCVFHGKTAIVTAHTVFEILSNGVSVTANTRMIHVWVKKGKEWKLVAHQTTKL